MLTARHMKFKFPMMLKIGRQFILQKEGVGHTEEITDLDALGRYVRMYGTERSAEYGHSLWEFEIFDRE